MSIPDGMTLAQYQEDYRSQLPAHMSKLTARELDVPEKVRSPPSPCLRGLQTAPWRTCVLANPSVQGGVAAC